MKLHFYKYHGTGNDFIMLRKDSERKILTENQIAHLCHRHFGIGADGLIELYVNGSGELFMTYYNSDGREASMCGNGGRCFAAFAFHQQLSGTTCYFTAIDGLHQAKITEHNHLNCNVLLQLSDVNSIQQLSKNTFVLNTGSPHYVRFEKNVSNIDILAEGKEIRYSDDFSPEGINVNIVEEQQDSLFVRTYERGVENETLSCGTGVTASALAYAFLQGTRNGIIPINTLGGSLKVHYEAIQEGFRQIILEGPAMRVFEGEIEL